MIFVTLGSQKFQFNRLLIKVDELIEKKVINDEVFAQIGASDYKPKNYKYVEFMSSDEFADMESKMDLLITHGGTGAIVGAVKKGKRVIAVPRLSKYGEHVDDHQTQLLEQFDGMGMIKACYELDELEQIYKQIYELQPVLYKSNTKQIITSIEKFLLGRE